MLIKQQRILINIKYRYRNNKKLFNNQRIKIKYKIINKVNYLSKNILKLI